MQRWNGWGDARTDYPLPENAHRWLRETLGPLEPPQDAPLDEVLAGLPESTLPDHALIATDREARLRHARGQSLPDWVALRSGRIGRVPDGVAYPEGEDDLEALYRFARQRGAVLIPYGGGTSVVGGITPEPESPPVITVDLQRMSKFLNYDETSRLATFGAGIRGPNLEAALRAHNATLGHFPQSFERSTLGGWVATRSSGQQSLYYGRIEDHFAGGRMISPCGPLVMPPFPASAAGPDLRQMVLGSEGRMGIISEVTVRVSPLPEYEAFHAVFFPTWQQGVQAVREMVQARLPLSMLRLSNAAETEANLTLAGHEKLVNAAHTGLRVLGQQRGEKCMLLFGATGPANQVRTARRDALRIARKHGGFHTGRYMGTKWAEGRFRTPYLRNTLWEHGVAIDTLETIVPWARVEMAADAIQTAIRQAAEAVNEPVFVFAHLSHLYTSGASIYITYLFHVRPDSMLANWHRMKGAASRAIVEHGGSITHQHAVGTDHAPYLEAEKGPLGMALIGEMIDTCDPDRLLNPGKLIKEVPHVG